MSHKEFGIYLVRHGRWEIGFFFSTKHSNYSRLRKKQLCYNFAGNQLHYLDYWIEQLRTTHYSRILVCYGLAITKPCRLLYRNFFDWLWLVICERRFGFQVHMLLIFFSKFQKYENTLKSSENNWTQIYTSVQPSCKILEENNIFCGLCKKTNLWLKNKF